MKKIVFYIVSAVVIVGVGSACSKDKTEDEKPNKPDVIDDVTFDINSISDTYAELSSFANVYKWGSHNVHDPSILKVGNEYYCFSTDVGYGIDVRPGIQVRKSTDLIQWTFLGWVFDALPEKGANYIKSKSGQPFNALWAPFVMKVGNEYRLYYSLSSSTPRLSVIGLAVASGPLGPWKEKDIVVVSANDNTIQTNAIDPSVIVSGTGQHWLYYGSAWDGIYKLELNPTTGLAKVSGDKGVRVAQRGFTGTMPNGNIEAAEVVYNAQFNMYYMFISYDWLQTKYNVRVGRSTSAEGPFLDYFGNDINNEQDNIPMILAPYQFSGHSGYQGVAHQCVFSDEKGQFFIAHQARPGIDSYFMNLHVRKLHWTQDGWPIVSPERYAGVEQKEITKTELVGKYEQIILGYNVVPGYEKEQTNPDFQKSINLELNANGNINGDTNNNWTYDAPWLTLTWGGVWKDVLYVERGRDWENKKESTILLTGLNNQGTAIWGKKIN